MHEQTRRICKKCGNELTFSSRYITELDTRIGGNTYRTIDFIEIEVFVFICEKCFNIDSVWVEDVIKDKKSPIWEVEKMSACKCKNGGECECGECQCGVVDAVFDDNIKKFPVFIDKDSEDACAIALEKFRNPIPKDADYAFDMIKHIFQAGWNRALNLAYDEHDTDDILVWDAINCSPFVHRIYCSLNQLHNSLSDTTSSKEDLLSGLDALINMRQAELSELEAKIKKTRKEISDNAGS
jgi:hypothetical protein